MEMPIEMEMVVDLFRMAAKQPEETKKYAILVAFNEFNQLSELDRSLARPKCAKELGYSFSTFEVNAEHASDELYATVLDAAVRILLLRETDRCADSSDTAPAEPNGPRVQSQSWSGRLELSIGPNGSLVIHIPGPTA